MYHKSSAEGSAEGSKMFVSKLLPLPIYISKLLFLAFYSQKLFSQKIAYYFIEVEQ